MDSWFLGIFSYTFKQEPGTHLRQVGKTFAKGNRLCSEMIITMIITWQNGGMLLPFPRVKWCNDTCLVTGQKTNRFKTSLASCSFTKTFRGSKEILRMLKFVLFVYFAFLNPSYILCFLFFFSFFPFSLWEFDLTGLKSIHKQMEVRAPILVILYGCNTYHNTLYRLDYGHLEQF